MGITVTAKYVTVCQKQTKALIRPKHIKGHHAPVTWRKQQLLLSTKITALKIQVRHTKEWEIPVETTKDRTSVSVVFMSSIVFPQNGWKCWVFVILVFYFSLSRRSPAVRLLCFV